MDVSRWCPENIREVADRIDAPPPPEPLFDFGEGPPHGVVGG
jgi:hypothetical protein